MTRNQKRLSGERMLRLAKGGRKLMKEANERGDEETLLSSSRTTRSQSDKHHRKRGISRGTGGVRIGFA